MKKGSLLPFELRWWRATRIIGHAIAIKPARAGAYVYAIGRRNR
jgi:hypothetical protein